MYYEGLMAFYALEPRKAYLDYAVNWGRAHQWNLRDGIETRNADNQACGQTYIDLYGLDRQPERLAAIEQNMEKMLNSPKNSDWTWIDALQMAMPVMAKLGVLRKDDRYFEKMYALYNHTKTVEGGGLYNPEDGLWWRDKDFVAPYKEPNGQDCYWSRGNGWVYAALVRVLDVMPKTAPHRQEYEQMFQAMSKALVPIQRPDGLWNVSLHDSTHFGGKEITGSALFAYGMAWGIRTGRLPAATYRPVVIKAWHEMAKAVHPNGFLGYVQGTGKEPKDGQPVTYDREPNFEDFGLGCFLLAGAEVARMK